MTDRGLGVQCLLGRFGVPKGRARRSVWRARLVLDIGAGVDPAVMQRCVVEALTAAATLAGAQIVECQVGLAADPGWVGAGPRPLPVDDTAPVEIA